MSPWSFDTQVQVQTLSQTYNGLGAVNSWSTTEVLWCSLVQPTKNMYVQVHLEFGQRFATSVIYRVLFRGVKTFDYANTQFLWTDVFGSVRTLKPRESQRIPGSRHTYYTSMLVEDITGLANPSV